MDSRGNGKEEIEISRITSFKEFFFFYDGKDRNGVVIRKEREAKGEV